MKKSISVVSKVSEVPTVPTVPAVPPVPVIQKGPFSPFSLMNFPINKNKQHPEFTEAAMVPIVIGMYLLIKAGNNIIKEISKNGNIKGNVITRGSTICSI